MCGIIGYIGQKEAVPILVNGLKKLEYRGYDSAGIAAFSEKGVYSRKAVGRVSQLEHALLENNWHDSHLGIAHTRWATHGQPSEANAHPHSDCKNEIWVVHNGIVENYQELKSFLVEKGHVFRSETDTEVLAHLIEEESKTHEYLFDSVRHALQKVRGTYGVAVITAEEPDKIIAARNSSPLILGVGDGENLVASDASAVIGLTKKVIYLEDGEIAEVTERGFRVENVEFGLNGAEKKEKHLETIEWDEEKIEKNGHPHFMHKEIFEAPETIINSTRGRIVLEEGLAKLGGIESVKEELRLIKRIVITACGTASYAGLIGEYMLEEYAGIPTEVDVGSELRYRKPVFDKDTLLIAISQSGETADTLAAIKEAKEKGAMTMGIVNVVGSSIARETGVGVYNHAGPEISVASTKAFISQLTVLSLLTMFLGRQRDMSLTTGKRIGEELQRLPELIKSLLDQEETIKGIAKKYQNATDFLCLGRKYNFPIALEAALKLKEICYIHGEGIPAGEIKHGPIALIQPNFPTLLIAPQDSMYEKMRSTIEEIKARSGPIVAITTEGNTELDSYSQDVIYIPKTLEMLTPILAVIPIYLLTYHISILRGNDVDKPRNLAKSVTVE